jgi:hypothetical protein
MNGPFARRPIKQADRLTNSCGGWLFRAHVGQDALDGPAGRAPGIPVSQAALFILTIPLNL